MKETLTCFECGAEITNGTATEFDGHTLCEDCFNSITTICDCCGDRIYSDDAQGNLHVTLCNHC